ncbi:MFS transporter [Saccharopolyspora sp. WRP15-2]|uniref:MFS transporter n=1 Tax=Saccharopolyspora oryzae TaxID=2997343 RepID=A0ABT4UV93_9PSEU|nr:MFS transporter [Saccharopolyspora oryzae]MDA3625473.1 MFS transporter [Saccharopolyspora oryzae]
MSTATTSRPAAENRAVLRRVVTAGGVGTLIEYFDYASYSYLATTMATVFFPTEDRSVALLSTFAVFALSFLVRPIGALLWGSLGDRLGRKRILATTILLMAGSTFAIGLIPGYASIGIAAPALLLLLRMTQSFSASGEYAGAGTFIAEYAPDRKRGLFTSMVPMSSAAGFLLASAMTTTLYSALSPAAMETWGWRVPFLLSGPLGLVGLYLRFRLEETPQYRRLVEAERAARPAPQRSKLADLPGMGKLLLIMALNAGGYYLLLGYVPTYLIEQVGMSEADSNLVVMIALVAYVAIIPVTASLSDRLGRKRILIAACALLILLSYPMMVALSFGGMVLTTSVLVLLLAMFSLNDAVFPAFFAEAFATRSRYLGFALPFNVGAVLFGGVAPYAATWLIAQTGNSHAPAFFLVAVAALSLIGVLLANETARKPLPEDRAS